MKKTMVSLLCFIVVLSGCLSTETGSTDSIETTENRSVESIGEAEAPDPLTRIRQSLSQGCSFQSDELYRNLASFGFSRTILQESAKDGSFRFLTESHQWDYGSEFDEQTVAEFYYQYENGILVCYRKQDGQEAVRIPMTKSEEAELAAGREQILGQANLLPEYLTEFTDLGAEEESGRHEFSFRLPLSEVLADDALLSSFVSNACAMSGYTARPGDDLHITAFLSTDDAMRPTTLKYDLTELKPYVLSEGALSGEFALDTDLMYMTFEFDYDLAESISVPEGF